MSLVITTITIIAASKEEIWFIEFYTRMILYEASGLGV